MKKAFLTLAATALMTLAPASASAAVRVFVRSGPVFYGGYGYAPFWSGYWGPRYVYGYYPNSGEVKLDTKVKDAQVFINGAYAGTTHDNKTMHLRQGNYNISIKTPSGQTAFAENVYVTNGKTIHIKPEL